MTDKKSHMQLLRELQFRGAVLKLWEKEGDWFIQVGMEFNGAATLIATTIQADTFEHVIEKTYQWCEDNLT